MSDTQNNAGGSQEREAIATLEQISREIGVDAPTRDPAKLCETYRRIRPLLERLLPWIERIHPKLAEAIRFLMSVADAVCPTPDR